MNSTATQDIGTIARGASTQVSWVVRATGTASGDQSLSVQIDSTNEGSKSVSHTIQIPDLPRPTTQPDALIRLDSESDDQYGGVDVFQTTPSGAQVKTQTVGPNVTAGYKVRIVNASTESVTRAYVVKATTSAEAGWVVTYKVGNTDITAQATGSSGYATPSLAPGAGMVIAVDMRPGRAVVAGTTKSATVQAYMDNRLVDAVQAVTTVGSVSLVDLLAKLGTESEGAYALDDTYQPQAAGAQVRTHLIPSGGRATFQVKVQNDGNAADAQHFVIRAAQSAEAGWTVVYRVGSTDITSSITGTDGYQTPALQAGASMIITIEMTADAAVRGGTGKSTVLRASLEGSSQVLDCVQAVATVAAVTAPDLLIKQAGEPESAFGTNDTYQVAPGGGQIESQTVDAGGTATYDIRLENDDNTGTARTFVLKAVAGVEPGWQLVYRLGTTDITSSICDDRGYTTALLAPGQSLTLSLDVSPTAAAVGGNSKAAIVRVYLGGGDATVRDAVQATTRLNSAVQPDLLIKQGAEPEWLYSVNGSYQTTPSGEQVETQGVSPGGTAVYNVKLQNDGNVTRSFVVKALENTVTGWTVVYKTDGRDVTTLVKSAAGFTTTTLLPAGAVTFTIEVTAGDHAQGDTSKIVTLSALLGSNEVTPRDAVQAVTIADAVVQPDLLAKRNGEGDAALVGDDIYQASPATPQLLRQTVAAGQRATYWIRVQNDGNEPRAFTLRAVEAGAAGWTVSYKVGTAVVNAGITGTGGFRTPTIMPGSSLTVGVEMTPGTAAVVGATKSTAVAVLLDGADTTVRDVVQLDSSLAPADQPDLAIKPGAAADTAYVINNVYQSSPWGGQVLGQTAAAGAKVVYHIRLENDGARTRSFVLKTAESSGSGWSIVYKIGSTVVTPTIKGTSGYLVANLTAHSRVVLTVEVTPAANLAAAATKTVTVKASFAGETTVRDSVQAVTSVALREQPDLLIKDGRSTAAYAIDNTYYSVPGGAQLLRLTAVPGTPSRSWVRVQNDGNAARAFVLRGVDGTAAGWSIAYKVGATNVTASMKSAGGYTTAVLNPGAYLVVAVEMAPAVTVGVGARSSATVKAFLRATDATPRDCVMVYTTRGATPAP